MDDKGNLEEIERLLNYSHGNDSSKEYDVVFEDGHYFIHGKPITEKSDKNISRSKTSDLNGWKKIIFEKINGLNSEIFSLNDLYEFIPEFQRNNPNNHHIKDKIRQTLQQLKNLNLIEFLGRGEYKNLSYNHSNLEKDGNFDNSSQFSLKYKFISWYSSMAPDNHKRWFKNNLKAKINEIDNKYHASFYHNLFDIDLDKKNEEIGVIQLNIYQRRAAMNKTFENYVRMSGGIAKEIITYYLDFLKNKEFEKELSNESSYKSDFQNNIESESDKNRHSTFDPLNNKNKDYSKYNDYKKQSLNTSKSTHDKDLDYFKFIIRNFKGWNKAVFDKIMVLGSESFTSQDLFVFASDFQVLFPNNNDIKKSISNSIQKLRSLGLIESVSRGKYKNRMYWHLISEKNNEEFNTPYSNKKRNKYIIADNTVNTVGQYFILQNASDQFILEEFLEYFNKVPISENYKFWINDNIKIKIEEINVYYKWSFKKSLFDIKSQEDIEFIEKNIDNSNKNSSFERYNSYCNGIAKGIIQNYTKFLKSDIFKTEIKLDKIENVSKNIKLNEDSNILTTDSGIKRKIKLDNPIFSNDTSDEILNIEESVHKDEKKICEFCGEPLPKNYSKNICKNCNRKSYAIKIVNILLTHFTPEFGFTKEKLISLGYDSIQVSDYIWILLEYGLIIESSGKYYLEKKEILDKFIEENNPDSGDTTSKIDFNKNIESERKNSDKWIKNDKISLKLKKICSECGENLPISNFALSDKNKNCLSKYCKKCSRKLLNNSSFNDKSTNQKVGMILKEKINDFENGIYSNDFNIEGNKEKRGNNQNNNLKVLITKPNNFSSYELNDFQVVIFEKINEINREHFALKDLYKFIPLFRMKFSNVNKKIIETTLMELIDLNLIESNNNGYKIINGKY
ncbi:hypothetical protein SDC9_07705 [bioreactor metagenome]|uniref:Dam-replacing protein HTH domain-containing protein n=1 Tax=bioreactor metagenome TaxID=1076179 RepID=A0A644T596_9ZZZZ|nr:hypothetical protein [Methanobrevibacter sp.]MEA4956570.1 hypothetical protein [Methanobrevibacter sp.]